MARNVTADAAAAAARPSAVVSWVRPTAAVLLVLSAVGSLWFLSRYLRLYGSLVAAPDTPLLPPQILLAAVRRHDRPGRRCGHGAGRSSVSAGARSSQGARGDICCVVDSASGCTHPRLGGGGQVRTSESVAGNSGYHRGRDGCLPRTAYSGRN